MRKVWYRINIRKDLIEQELKQFIDDGFVFQKHKLSKRFIDWLFRHYYTAAFDVEWYDSEPETTDGEFDKLYSSEQGIKEYARMCDEYEPERLLFNNWVDPYGEGIWYCSQDKVDKYAKFRMKSAVKTNKKDRVYFGQKGNEIMIYIYHRDTLGYDERWYMKKRNKIKSVGVYKSEVSE